MIWLKHVSPIYIFLIDLIISLTCGMTNVASPLGENVLNLQENTQKLQILSHSSRLKAMFT